MGGHLVFELHPGSHGRILVVFGSHPVCTERHWRQHEHYELPRKREFFAA
jgi:hypothetical protein